MRRTAPTREHCPTPHGNIAVDAGFSLSPCTLRALHSFMKPPHRYREFFCTLSFCCEASILCATCRNLLHIVAHWDIVYSLPIPLWGLYSPARRADVPAGSRPPLAQQLASPAQAGVFKSSALRRRAEPHRRAVRKWVNPYCPFLEAIHHTENIENSAVGLSLPVRHFVMKLPDYGRGRTLSCGEPPRRGSTAPLRTATEPPARA